MITVIGYTTKTYTCEVCVVPGYTKNTAYMTIKAKDKTHARRLVRQKLARLKKWRTVSVELVNSVREYKVTLRRKK